MPQVKQERRLAAILAADIVNYSGLMEADEAGTLAAIRALRSDLVEPQIADHRGRIVKLMGDGALCEFASVVDAVACAVAIQTAMAERQEATSEGEPMRFRIGINLGDVVVEDDGDLYGDGVNVAARLEQLAEPGGILISGTAYDHLQGKLDCDLIFVGERALKNIVRPVRVYHVGWQRHPIDEPKHSVPAQPRLPNRASIAVLPFTNMSSDPEQEYFADGLAEDLITDLSKVPGLLVIARNSSFTYKGRPVDIRSVARELGVRYVIEGSVRRAAARIRINAQLIDASNNSHLWADRFDRDLADMFALQDEVVGRIVDALADALPSARPIASRRATSLEAYDLFVRGRVLVTQSVEGNRMARPLLERSVEIDPGFAEAHAWLAMSHHFAWAYWGEATERHPVLALEAAQRAMSLDPEDAVAHAILADVLIFAGRSEEGAAELAAALRINPNHADAWTFLGQLRAFEGSALEGIDYVRKALRLNPYPPGWYYWLLGLAQYAAGRYEDAVDTLRHESTRGMGSQRILAASLAQLGRVEEAQEEAKQFLASHPHFSMQQWADTQPFRHEADRQHFIDGYVKAGLPR
jgi:TolB-like protein/class 3 adenylate cyclase/Flp pilus assembly protein TadD